MKPKIMNRIFAVAILLSLMLLVIFFTMVRSLPKDLNERAEDALEYCKSNEYSTNH